MSKVLVTGANGFIGKNLCAHLKRDESLELLFFNHENSDEDLQILVEQADFIFHLAGVNRPKNESDFDTTNRGLTEKIVKILTKAGKKTPLLISSSTQAELDNKYGKSKKAAEDCLIDWSNKSGGRAYIFRLPGVFGKWSKPNYNSVVATFSNNIANGLEISINKSAPPLTLVYIDDVVKEFINCLAGKVKPTTDSYYEIHKQYTTTLTELVAKLESFHKSRENLLVPSFEDEFTRSLYATFISYLSDTSIGYKLDKKNDERGWLTEFIKSQQFGQIYISRTKPGFTRGIHWHDTKIEKFFVIEGEAEVRIRDLYSNTITTYNVSGTDLEVLEMPAGRVHSIKNTGTTDMFLLIWSQQIFNPEHPDTYWEDV